jgi:glucose/mannose-6-phosphate isomerase
MNLDDLQTMHQLDAANMLGEIDALPAQLEQAWQAGLSMPLFPAGGAPIERVLLSGMGGSAIGADLVSAFLAPLCPLPISLSREYEPPAWVHGPSTLVIASSHSGNTEETLAAFDASLERDCRLLVLCTGGELERRAMAADVPVWKFTHAGQPRAAVGFSFALLLSAFIRLGLAGNPQDRRAEFEQALRQMRSQQETLKIDVPVARNPAKRLAGQLVGRWVNVYAAGALAPVARRWKGQINELAKAGAGFELLPEADHNALAGTLNPEAILANTFTLFLDCTSNHPRNRLRLDLTRQAFLAAGLNTDAYLAQEGSALAQMWSALHFGDYMAYYLAMAYGVDPTPVEALQDFKASMKAIR